MSGVAVEGEVRYVCARCGAQKPASGMRCPACGVRNDLAVEPEAAVEARAAERRAVRRVFRLYCVACGRSTEGPAPPPQVGRCPTCGGTMLVELATDSSATRPSAGSHASPSQEDTMKPRRPQMGICRKCRGVRVLAAGLCRDCREPDVPAASPDRSAAAAREDRSGPEDHASPTQ